MKLAGLRILRTTRIVINSKNEYERVVEDKLQYRELFGDWRDVPIEVFDLGMQEPKEGQHIVATPFQIDPSERDWEYDDGGVRVYKTSRKPYVL